MYKFYIDGVMLPIAPSYLKVKIDNKDETVDLVNGGTLSILNSPGLTTFSFDFILPAYPIGNNFSEFHEPDYYTRKLELLKLGKKPFQFVVIRTDDSNMSVVHNLNDTNIQVSLNEYQITEDADSYGFHKLVSMSLQEYQLHTTKSDVEIDSNGGTITVPEPERNITVYQYTTEVVSGTTHKVKEGDTFQSISQQWYGTMDYWEAIAKYNGLDPNTELKEGMYLSMSKGEIEVEAEEIDEEHEEEQKKDYETASNSAIIDAILKTMPGTNNIMLIKEYGISDELNNELGKVAKGFNDGMKNLTGWWPW